MRGKAINASKKKTIVRITPAYAGKRCLLISRSLTNRDHPRLCGEKETFSHSPLFFKGSPPPMRGKVAHSTRSSAVYGITPAYAGKSKIQDRFVFIFQDHPRLCGEKTFQFVQFFLCVGSPPPMRGKEKHGLSCPMR